MITCRRNKCVINRQYYRQIKGTRSHSHNIDCIRIYIIDKTIRMIKKNVQIQLLNVCIICGGYQFDVITVSASFRGDSSIKSNGKICSKHNYECAIITIVTGSLCSYKSQRISTCNTSHFSHIWRCGMCYTLAHILTFIRNRELI